MKRLKFIFAFFLTNFTILFSGIETHFKPCLNKDPELHKIRNIDFIYMINLDQRPEKLESCTKQLHPFGIFPYRFSAVNGWELSLDVINDVGIKFEPWMKTNILGTYYPTDGSGELPPHYWKHEIIHVIGRNYFCHTFARGTIGIALSHLSILQDAYNSKYETIWVMEDDIQILKNPNIIPDLIDRLDSLLGKNGWDVLFTDRDMLSREGKYIPCLGYALRPNFTPSNPSKFLESKNTSPDFRKIGARYGAHSMIIRRSGIKKILEFFKTYHIFLPYDLDFIFPEGIRLYTVTSDVVTNQTHALSDNGDPYYKNKK